MELGVDLVGCIGSGLTGEGEIDHQPLGRLAGKGYTDHDDQQPAYEDALTVVQNGFSQAAHGRTPEMGDATAVQKGDGERQRDSSVYMTPSQGHL
jgi:hypothetical protein